MTDARARAEALLARLDVNNFGSGEPEGYMQGILRALLAELDAAEKSAQYWQEEAKRYAQNAEFWENKAITAVARAIDGLTEEQMGTIWGSIGAARGSISSARRALRRAFGIEGT